MMTVGEIEATATRPRQPLKTVELPADSVLALIADWRAMREYIQAVEDTTTEFYSALGCRKVLNALKVKP